MDESAEGRAPVLEAVPVRVGHDLNVQGQAADYGALATYLTPAAADQARIILPYDRNRHRATVSVSFATQGGFASGLTGSVTSPGTFTNIVAAAGVAAGVYMVTVTTQLTGTTAVADLNNMRLVMGPGNSIPLAAIPGGSTVNGPFLVTVPVSTQSLIIQSAGATPTTGAVYSGQITWTPATPPVLPGVWVGTQAQVQALPPVGAFLPVGTTAFPIENNQGLWMIGDGINAVRVNVLQERWDSPVT